MASIILKMEIQKPYIVSENWHGFQNIKEEKISFFQRHLKLGFKHAFFNLSCIKPIERGDD